MCLYKSLPNHVVYFTFIYCYFQHQDNWGNVNINPFYVLKVTPPFGIKASL